MRIEFIPLSHFLKIHNEYVKMHDQMENTCGPYGLTYILRGLGYYYHGDLEVTEDYLAKLARTRIAPEEEATRKETMTSVLYGRLSFKEAAERHGKLLYRYELPISTRLEELGTSAEGVKHALETVTNGKLLGIPIPSRKGNTIYFTKEVFQKLIDLLIEKVDEWEYQALLNIQTSHLINHVSPIHDMFLAIMAYKPEEALGASPWKVGHFVSLAGFVRRINEREENFMLLRDTYKNAGYRGYHIQPAESVRKALVRDDGREGGILLIVEKELAGEVEEELRKLNLIVSLWNNGSPF